MSLTLAYCRQHISSNYAIIITHSVWCNDGIDNNKFEMFLCLSEFLSDNDVDIKMIKEIITAHLISLQTNFNARFEDFPEESLGWIRNPFHFSIIEIKLGNLKISKELIDLSSDENLRIRIQENACDTFWFPSNMNIQNYQNKPYQFYFLLHQLIYAKQHFQH